MWQLKCKEMRLTLVTCENSPEAKASGSTETSISRIIIHAWSFQKHLSYRAQLQFFFKLGEALGIRN